LSGHRAQNLFHVHRLPGEPSSISRSIISQALLGKPTNNEEGQLLLLLAAAVMSIPLPSTTSTLVIAS